MGQRNLGNSTKNMRTSFLEFSTLKMGKTMLHLTKVILLISMIQLCIVVVRSGQREMPPKLSVNSYRLWECLSLGKISPMPETEIFHGEFLEHDPSKLCF